MKFSALNNQLNVSRTRSESISPSLQIDSRNYPHISWMERKNGVNEVRYSFWDGSKWSYLDNVVVFNSEYDVIYSPKALVLSPDENPIISFVRRTSDGSKLFLSDYDYEEKWNFNTLDVDYDVKWNGVIRYNRNIEYSTSSLSSSSSIDSSSSSSTVKLSSSSSSVELSFSSSSSSLLYSSLSSSSSIDSNSSSSSSSFNDAIYFVIAYDETNNLFKIYSVTDSVWNLLGYKIANLSNFSTIRCSLAGRKISLAFNDDDKIYYNFFDIDELSWSFASFKELSFSSSYGEIIEMTMQGYNIEDKGIIFFGWSSRDDNNSYLISVEVDDMGNENATDNIDPIIVSNKIDVITSDNYFVNGYRNLAMSYQDDYLNLISVGAFSELFNINIPSLREWNNDIISIEGVSHGVAPKSVTMENKDIAISDNSGDVYYFKFENAGFAFPESTPVIALMNEKWVHMSEYKNGLLKGEDVSDAYNTYFGSILKDSKRKILITVTEESNPPALYSSSSSSSS